MTKFLALAVAGFVAVSASSAFAATITNTGTFGPIKTDFAGQAFTVAGFDTTLGTLTSVSVTLAASATVSGSVTNNAATPQSFRVSTTTNVAVSSANTSINGINVDLISTQSYAAVAGNGGTASYGPFTPSATSAPINGTPLSAFTAGPISLSATSLSATTILGGGNNIAANIASTALGTVTIVYTYTAATTPPTTVPEPASMALLGMGLAGLGLIRRRRA